MEQSQDIGELAKALSLAQSEIRDAEKDRTNPHFKSKYATLSSIWDACREPLTKNGLAVVQSPCSSSAEGYIGLATTLLHSSGQWMRDAVFVRLAKDDPQGAGSGLTYLRRYSLAAFVGVCPDDDDGNAGAESGQRQQQQRQSAPESRGDAAATKNCNGAAIDWKTRCVARLDVLFPSAKGNGNLHLALASRVLPKPVETFEGWGDAHWRGYLERLEKLSAKERDSLISQAFAAVADGTPAPNTEDDPFVDTHPCQQEASATAQGA